MSIRITIPRSELVSATSRQLSDLLCFKGLDTSKEWGMFEEGLDNVYVGESLPEPHSGFMKTCVGMVPIKKPWLEAVA